MSRCLVAAPFSYDSTIVVIRGLGVMKKGVPKASHLKPNIRDLLLCYQT